MIGLCYKKQRQACSVSRTLLLFQPLPKYLRYNYNLSIMPLARSFLNHSYLC